MKKLLSVLLLLTKLPSRREGLGVGLSLSIAKLRTPSFRKSLKNC